MEDNFFKRFIESFVSRTVINFLGILGTLISIYAFLQEKKVDLRYEIIANTNVLDFNADVSKLEVLYDNSNLKKTQENLRIYTIKIINNGEQNVIKELYDSNDPLGVKIINGKIIELPQIIQSSDDYIKRNLKVLDYEKNKICFSQIIIEPGEFFIVKLLVLHNKKITPKIVPIGKVAGQQNINVVNSIDLKNELSFWQKVFFGNIWIQILRFFIYLSLVILIIFVLGTISEKVVLSKHNRLRLKLIKEFKNQDSYHYIKIDEAIFDRYKSEDIVRLKMMKPLIENEKNLNKKYKESIETYSNNDNRNYLTDFNIINEMINDGIVFKDQDNLVINQTLGETLIKFVNFIKSKEKLKKTLL